MSINKAILLLLQLLLIISLGIGCWARPKMQPEDPAFNEVTSQESGMEMSNKVNEVLSALRSPLGNYKKRRSSYKPKFLQRSQFRGRYYNVPAGRYPEVGVIPPGGANYYSNEVLPLSTYEIYEPEPMYY